MMLVLMSNGKNLLSKRFLLLNCIQLKHDKKDADVELNSSAIIYAPPIVFRVLCLLVNAIVLHGHVPLQ